MLAEDKPITSLAAARIQRWAIILSSYYYTLTYKSGATNSNADCLSRLLTAQNVNESSKLDNVVYLTELDASPVTSEEVSYHTKTDAVLSKICTYVKRGWQETKDNKLLTPYYNRKLEISVEQDCIIWGNRVVIPSALRDKVLKDLHQSHPGISKMKVLVAGNG